MENRAHAIAAVAFLVVFAVGAVVIYWWLSNPRSEPLPYVIITNESAGGLSTQSEVRFKGLVVGHVQRIGFDRADRAKVVIHLQVQPDTYITHQTYAEVAMQGLTGGSVLELKLGPGSAAPLATSTAHPAEIPMHEGELGALLASAPKLLQNLQGTLAEVREILDPTNRAHVAATLAQLDTATGRLAAIEAQLPPLLAAAQRSVTASHALIEDSDRTMRAAQAPIQDAASLERSLQALADSTRQLSAHLDRQSVPNVDALTRSLDTTSRQLDRLLRELQARPQSLIFGAPRQPPGPGEPGFHGAPGGSAQP